MKYSNGIGIPCRVFRNKSKALTASISGSNLVGDHWMRSAINFVMDTTALIEVQNRIPQTIEELKRIEFMAFSYE